jgi:hypothetical protein
VSTHFGCFQDHSETGSQCSSRERPSLPHLFHSFNPQFRFAPVRIAPDLPLQAVAEYSKGPPLPGEALRARLDLVGDHSATLATAVSPARPCRHYSTSSFLALSFLTIGRTSRVLAWTKRRRRCASAPARDNPTATLDGRRSVGARWQATCPGKRRSVSAGFRPNGPLVCQKGLYRGRRDGAARMVALCHGAWFYHGFDEQERPNGTNRNYAEVEQVERRQAQQTTREWHDADQALKGRCARDCECHRSVLPQRPRRMGL